MFVAQRYRTFFERFFLFLFLFRRLFRSLSVPVLFVFYLRVNLVFVFSVIFFGAASLAFVCFCGKSFLGYHFLIPFFVSFSFRTYKFLVGFSIYYRLPLYLLLPSISFVNSPRFSYEIFLKYGTFFDRAVPWLWFLSLILPQFFILDSEEPLLFRLRLAYLIYFDFLSHSVVNIDWSDLRGTFEWSKYLFASFISLSLSSLLISKFGGVIILLSEELSRIDKVGSCESNGFDSNWSVLLKFLSGCVLPYIQDPF